MKFEALKPEQARDVIELFTDVFTVAEGPQEGQLIGQLVTELLDTTDSEELFGYVSNSDGRITGCILFSRLQLPSGKSAFILSPVAIATRNQGRGLGQQLISYGIQQLKKHGAELVFTYGDPSFYSKTGFEKISEDTVKAPRQLSHPEGWLAQSLDDKGITAESGAAKCVPALDKQVYW